MDNFKVIYKILKAFEGQMDNEEFCAERFSGEAFGISEPRYKAIMAELVRKGYVTGVMIKEYTDGGVNMHIQSNARITIEGMEYLAENSMMKKVVNAAKGICEII